MYRPNITSVAVLLAVAVGVQAQETANGPDPASIVARIQGSTVQVKKLLNDVEQLNDELMIKCVRKKLKQLRTLEAGALGIAAKVAATRSRELRINATLQMQESADKSTELVEEAQKCLQIQGGLIINYAQSNPMPAPDVLPELPDTGGDLGIIPGPIEFLPRELPISNAELP